MERRGAEGDKTGGRGCNIPHAALRLGVYGKYSIRTLSTRNMLL